jgi:hypothetical protein
MFLKDAILTAGRAILQEWRFSFASNPMGAES